MRNLLAVALMALAFSACATEPATDANLRAAATPAATPAPTPAFVESDIVENEKRLWDAIKSKNAEAFAAMLADELVYVTSDGLYDKSQTVEAVKKLNLTESSISEAEVLKVDDDAAVVYYTLRSKGTLDGQPLPEKPEYNSTTWVKRGGKWLAIHHQDSYVEEQAAQGQNPDPRPAAPPSATASPASSPAATAPAADPISAENAVWDALRRRDTEGFARHLADEFTEIFPMGIYKKPQIVAEAGQADFSSAKLSDFKEVKVDEDAALVTYVSKGPREVFGPQGFRQTTVWSKRDGRWLAVFHHGTFIR